MSTEQPDSFRFTLNIRDVENQILPEAPENWLDTKVTYKTDSTYKALRRSLTLPLDFVGRGAYFLRNELYTYGGLSNVKLLIDKLRLSDWSYDRLYTGDIVFSKSVDKLNVFTADAIQNDFTKQLDAYDKVTYALPLEGEDVLDIQLPSLNLRESADFIMLPSENDLRSDAFFGIQVVNNRQVASQRCVQNAGFFAQSHPNFGTTNQWIYQSTVATKVRMYGKMSIFLATLSGPSVNVEINVYRSDGVKVKTLFAGTANLAPVAYDFDFDFITNVAQGERLILYVENTTNDNSNVGVNVQSGTVTLEYNTITPPTMCKGIRAYDVYKRLLKAMNNVPNEPNQPVPSESYLLNPAPDIRGPLRNVVYTCSDSVRSFYVNDQGETQSNPNGAIYTAGDNLQAGGTYRVLGSYVIYNGIHYDKNDTFKFVVGQNTFTSPDEEGFVKQIASLPTLLISFKDFFQDIFSFQGGQAGLGIENGKVVLENLPYFFRSIGGAYNLGIVDDSTKIEPATDMVYNKIKGGYKDPQLDSVNGLNEVCSEVQYVTDLLTPDATLDIQAVSCAAPYFIEITRVTPVDTSASRSDNIPMVIVIGDEPVLGETFYKPDQMDSLAQFAGVDPSYYNWFISPKQNFLRGGRYLRSIYDKMDGYTIKVASIKKNGNLITIDHNGNRVAEADNVEISAALGDQIFLPYYITANAAAPVDANDILENSPYGDISLAWNDVKVFGFARDINIDEGKNSAQNYKLLLTPDNKTVDLIR